VKRCLKCYNRKGNEVGPNWLCLSITECDGRVQERLAADPQYQAIMKAKENGKMAEAAATKERKEKVVKVGKCLVTGKETKGGLFAPGMDAKYVSLKVAEVEEKNFTKTAQEAALKQMKADGTSEKLQAKFVKAVGLAKDRADAKKAAEADKAAAKADKGKAKADTES
jgi:hypothetical protein